MTKQPHSATLRENIKLKTAQTPARKLQIIIIAIFIVIAIEIILVIAIVIVIMAVIVTLAPSKKNLWASSNKTRKMVRVRAALMT